MGFEQLGEGVCRNHTPYCKIYTQRKYTLFGGKTCLKKFAIRRQHLSIGGGQRGMVEDYTFTFFWYLSLIGDTIIVWEKFNLTSHRRV